MGLLTELFSSAVDDGELMYDLPVGSAPMPQQSEPMEQQEQEVPAPAPEIKKSLIRDGDGDGMIYDGTDQEQPVAEYSFGSFRKDGTPTKPTENDVYSVNPRAINIDATRFQYKVVGIGEGGVGGELKDTKVWNPILGGVLLVWRDPVEDKDYVINGHHRLELAKRTGVETINVRYVQADDAVTARGQGALANIAEGRGTAVDAAKYLRDTGTMVDDFVKNGVSLKGKIAADAVQLTKLSDKAFQKVSTGTMDESKAVAIARFLSDHDLQDKLIKRLEDREENGQEWTIKEIETASRKMANAGRLKTQGVDLFGEFESEESTFDQEVEIESYVRRQLAQEITDFSAVASQRRAERVADAGNVLAVDENLLRAKSAQILLDSFDRETGLRGPVSDAIKRLAGEFAGIKSKAKKTEFKTKAFNELKQLLVKSEVDPQLKTTMTAKQAFDVAMSISQNEGKPPKDLTDAQIKMYLVDRDIEETKDNIEAVRRA